MSGDRLKMTYPEVDEMVQILRQASQHLDEVRSEMMGVAEKIDEGALQGRGGDAFSAGVRGQLAPAIARLSDRLQEAAAYVQKERDDQFEAEQRAKGLF